MHLVFNMHELAITSRPAAAYRLGADFPHLGDETCVRLFRLYLCLSHAARLVKSSCLLQMKYFMPILFRGKRIERLHKLSHDGYSFSFCLVGQYCTVSQL